MRYRLMASFKGASYQAGVGPSDEEVTLFAASPPHEELGFLSSSNHWRKRVSVDDIDALWEARPVGRYRGEPCMVLDDLGDRMHIAYLGRDLYLARRLGFWEVDRGVFEVVVPRQDLDDLREERGEYELAVVGAAAGSSHGDWNQPNRETWAHTPREYGRPAPDTGPLRMIGSRGLIDTGPSWAADSRLSGLPQPMGWDDLRDVHAQDPRDTGTWAAVSETGELAESDERPLIGARLRAGRGRGVAEAFTKAEMLDVECAIEGETLAARPGEIRPLGDRRVGVAVVLLQFHGARALLAASCPGRAKRDPGSSLLEK